MSRRNQQGGCSVDKRVQERVILSWLFALLSALFAGLSVETRMQTGAFAAASVFFGFVAVFLLVTGVGMKIFQKD